MVFLSKLLTPTPRLLFINPSRRHFVVSSSSSFRRLLLTPTEQTRLFTRSAFPVMTKTPISSSNTNTPGNTSSNPQEKGTEEATPTKALSNKAKLKQAIKDYGSTVLVFHISMSLCSLGLCYLLVSSGLDVVSLLDKLGVAEKVRESSITAGAGTFVIAYAVHKVFAPVRITITLTATPLIVKKLRGLGILKKVKDS